MSPLLASIFLLLAFATVYSLEDGIAFANSAKGRTLKFAENRVSPVYLPLTNADKDPAASSFKIIGGVAMAKPCCTSWGPGRVDCFIKGKNSNILHWFKEGASYETSWYSLQGVVPSNVECISRETGILDLMVTGTNYALYVKSYSMSSGKWTPWISKGQRLLEQPSCVARTPDNISCMVRDSNARSLYIDQNDGEWTKWGSRGGVLAYPSKTSRRSATITDYWHVGSNSNLWATYRVNKKWGRWFNLGGSCIGQPEVVSTNTKRIDVLVRGIRNQLAHLVWNGRWQSWKILGGRIVDTPSCVALGSSLHCFMVQSDAYLYRRSYESGRWSPWFTTWGAYLEGPKCVVSNAKEKEVSCYIRGFDRSIVEIIYRF